MEINKLIKDITPHYNFYRTNGNKLSGSEALESFWEVGDLLVKFVEENKIAPHALYRKIYGKSEGKDDITQKSYITRDFLSRAYRIRNIFNNKIDIKVHFPGLKKFQLFYKAMPFIDNLKYAFIGPSRLKLYKLLNSNRSSTEVMKEISKLRKEKIGIKNPRTQKLVGMEKDKEIFVKFYNHIFDLFQTRNYKEAAVEFEELNTDFIKLLSQNTGAISADGLKMNEFELPEKIDVLWSAYSNLIKRLIEKKDSAVRRRFRRMIPPEKMVRLSEMLYALTSAEKYMNFKL